MNRMQRRWLLGFTRFLGIGLLLGSCALADVGWRTPAIWMVCSAMTLIVASVCFEESLT